MLSSIASYLFGGAEEEQETPTTTTETPTTTETETEENPRLKTRPADNEWVLVEKSRPRVRATPRSSATSKREDPLMECSLGHLFKQPSSSTKLLGPSTGSSRSSSHDVLDSSLCMSQGLGYHEQLDLGETSSCGQCSDTAESDVSSVPERVVHPSMEESWLVTPPACFTAGGSSKRMETSSMENLLIEHPSMSVYSHRGRQSSAGVDSDASMSDSEETPVQQPTGTRGKKNSRQAGLARHEPPRRPSALAARVGLTQVQLVKSMQMSQQRNMYKNLSSNRMRRSNIVREVKSQGSRKLRSHYVQQPRRQNTSSKQQY